MKIPWELKIQLGSFLCSSFSSSMRTIEWGCENFVKDKEENYEAEKDYKWHKVDKENPQKFQFSIHDPLHAHLASLVLGSLWTFLLKLRQRRRLMICQNRDDEEFHATKSQNSEWTSFNTASPTSRVWCRDWVENFYGRRKTDASLWQHSNVNEMCRRDESMKALKNIIFMLEKKKNFSSSLCNNPKMLLEENSDTS